MMTLLETDSEDSEDGEDKSHEPYFFMSYLEKSSCRGICNYMYMIAAFYEWKIN